MNLKFNPASVLILISLIAGQLLKIPNSSEGGLTLLDLCVAILIIWGIPNLKFRLQKPPLWIKTAGLFLAVMFISLAFSPLKLSLSQYGLSFSYALRFAAYLSLGWIAYSGGFPKLKEQIPLVLICAGSIMAVLGFGQLLLFPNLSSLVVNGWDPHYLRVVSTLLDPNFLGGFLTLIFLTILSFSRPPFRRALLAIIYAAILLTFSRSAYLSFGITLLTFSFLRKSPKMALVTLFLVGGLGLGYLGYQSAVAQPRGINRQQSAQYRVDSWQTGWKMFTSAPVLGVGFNAYRYALTEYNLAPTMFTQSRGASANDSSLLFVLSTTGIIGFLAFLFFLTSLARQNTLLLAGLAGIVAQSFFINSLFYPWMLIWLVLTVVQGE